MATQRPIFTQGNKKRCDWNGPNTCGNSVPISDIACHLHVEQALSKITMERISKAESSGASLPSLTEGRRVAYPTATYRSREEQTEEMIVEAIGLTPEDARSVFRAVQSLGNLEVPQIVANAMPAIFDRFQQALVSNGIRQDRLEVWRLLGMTRLTARGYWQKAPEAVHMVTLLDGRVTIDPFVALIASVGNVNESILVQLSEISGKNPIVDIPMIDSLANLSDREGAATGRE